MWRYAMLCYAMLHYCITTYAVVGHGNEFVWTSIAHNTGCPLSCTVSDSDLCPRAAHGCFFSACAPPNLKRPECLATHEWRDIHPITKKGSDRSWEGNTFSFLKKRKTVEWMVVIWHKKVKSCHFHVSLNMAIGITSAYISHKLFFTICWNEQIICSLSLLQLLFISQEADLTWISCYLGEEVFILWDSTSLSGRQWGFSVALLVSPSHPSAAPERWDSRWWIRSGLDGPGVNPP